MSRYGELQDFCRKVLLQSDVAPFLSDDHPAISLQGAKHLNVRGSRKGVGTLYLTVKKKTTCSIVNAVGSYPLAHKDIRGAVLQPPITFPG